MLGRETLDNATTLGTGVLNWTGTTKAIAYNSQGLPFTYTMQLGAGGRIINQDELVYNGLGQLTAEYQALGTFTSTTSVNTSTTPKVQYAYSSLSTGSRRISMTYPNGRKIDYSYNTGVDSDISRLSSISDDSTSTVLESYKYLGTNTVIERDHPEDGKNLTYIGTGTGDGGDQYTGLDRFGRVVDQKWTTSGGTVADEYQYGYDRDGNVLYKLNAVSTSNSELYAYDNLNRLTSFSRGTLNTGHTAISGTASETESWTLDALGNQLSVTLNGTTTTNTFNAQNEMVTSGSATLSYDANGNLTVDQTGLSYAYDPWNRLLEYYRLSTEMTHSIHVLPDGPIRGGPTQPYPSTQWGYYYYDAQDRRVYDAPIGRFSKNATAAGRQRFSTSGRRCT